MVDKRPDLKRSADPIQLFETKQDAAWHLAGLAGFWAGFGGLCLLWLIRAPGIVAIVPLAILVCGWAVAGTASRKLEERLTGRHVRPWPFGFPRLRTQIEATLPSTVIAAARRLDTNPVLVAGVVYALLGLDLIALFATWYARR